MVMRSFLILFLTTSSLFAQGGMFGFHGSPCPEGGTHDPELNHCFYCPQGAQLVIEPSSKAKKWCSGVALLGEPCPRGEDVWFDDAKNLCLYCSLGYTFSHDHTKCHK